MGNQADFDNQPKPHGIGGSIHKKVEHDIHMRALMGIKKYGEALRAFNGRNGLRDAYEEILDLAVYLRQVLEELEPAFVNNSKWRSKLDPELTATLLGVDAGNCHRLIYLEDSTQNVFCVEREQFEMTYEEIHPHE